MESNSLENHPVWYINGEPMRLPTNIEVDVSANGSFCPHWLALDDLIPNDIQPPTTPLEHA